MGVPAVIGKNGVEKIIELELNDEEKNSLQKSADSVKNAISNLNI
jgi:malate dehydrogenase